MPQEKIPGIDKFGDATSACGVSRSVLVSCGLQLF
ncbi:hypothetical protein SPAB_02250 [Salmonella enterica subsp. enterica serovar Paratyphi B str. SPB7]|uniref:Uncharacterized protein n=1 Tax=Salmonella paratyphi B (strain ATCC BAA-1250 / SPB7) TaxID=1016998 RepID=A0A6C6Z226_SALPB|nr:hypothetical protein SPAB_02250 [Salmonella enterica subsp. enterica serovar Paratyphi B str. SPB7]